GPAIAGGAIAIESTGGVGEAIGGDASGDGGHGGGGVGIAGFGGIVRGFLVPILRLPRKLRRDAVAGGVGGGDGRDQAEGGVIGRLIDFKAGFIVGVVGPGEIDLAGGNGGRG